VYAFFETEPIALNVTVANQTTEVRLLRFNAWPSGDTVRVVAALDGRPFPIEIELRSAVKRRVGLTMPVTDDGAIELVPRERVDWTVTLPRQLPVGAYRVELQLDGRDDQALPVAWQATAVDFEIRARSTESRPEELYRRALRYFLSDEAGHLDSAKQIANALLKLHPSSYAANALLGRVAEDEGDSNSAKRYFERATDLVERDQDRLLTKYKTRGEFKK